MGALKTLLAASVLCVAVTAPAMAYENLSGVWQGVYWGPSNQAVEFQATITDVPGPGFTGSIVEPNTFGDPASPMLLATLQGRAAGESVSFTKTYDGTAGQSHTVQYTGTLLSDRHIVGTWSLAGATGQFELAR
ncbi:MAG: hypothetical protein WDM79_09165 [Terricaulis sp.]